ncbi:unnamed protein product, partial [Symbiodinium sp. CCMP2456]
KGALQDDEANTRLPSYMNKFRLLNAPLALEVLALVVPAVAAFLEKLMKKGAKINKFQITEIVAFVLHVDLRSALPSKHKGQLLEWCKTRSEETDSPLKSWSSTSEPKCETWEDFQKHPLYRYWNFEHDSKDEDQSTFGMVRYLQTDIRLRLPKEIRGFPLKAPHLFYTNFVNGCINIPMTHVMQANDGDDSALPEQPLFFDAVPNAPATKLHTPEEQKPEPSTPPKKNKKGRNDPKTPESCRSSKSDPVSPPQKTPPSSSKRKR